MPSKTTKAELVTQLKFAIGVIRELEVCLKFGQGYPPKLQKEVEVCAAISRDLYKGEEQENAPNTDRL